MRFFRFERKCRYYANSCNQSCQLLYQLRGSDGECGPFGEIAEYISANHSGSIVTKEPLDLGEYGSVFFNEGNVPYFFGDEITIGQLLRGEFRMDMPDEQDDLKLE